MGWKVQGLAVAGSPDVSGLAGRPRDSGERVDLDAVFARPYDLGVASVGGWTWIADPHFRVVFDDQATTFLAAGTSAVAWVTNSVASVHGFAFYRDGLPLRRIVHAEGEVAEEHGRPLPQETSAPEPIGEDYVFEMIERVTEVAWGDVADALYDIWAYTD